MGKTGWCVSGQHGMCTDIHVDTYGCDCPCHLLRNPRKYNNNPQPVKEGNVYDLYKRILWAAEDESDNAKIAEMVGTSVATVVNVLRDFNIVDTAVVRTAPVWPNRPEYQCPSCGKVEGIRLYATVYTDVVTDTSGSPQLEEVDKDSQFEVNDEDDGHCDSCGYEGSAATFIYKEPQV